MNLCSNTQCLSVRVRLTTCISFITLTWHN